MYPFFHFITNFGDSGFIAILVFVLGCYLMMIGDRRQALALFIAFVASVIFVSTLKIIAWQHARFFDPLHLRSPSGHVAVSSAVYGAIGTFLCMLMRGWSRIIVLGIVLSLIGFIAVSRIVLEAHTANEVGAGLLCGVLSWLMATLFVLKRPTSSLNITTVLGVVLIVGILFHSAHLDAESWIGRIAQQFGHIS